MSEVHSQKANKSISKKLFIIFTVFIVVLIAVLLVFFRYKALLPIVVLLVVVVAIVVNRFILKKRKMRNTQEVTQCDLTDSDRKKFASYFVSQDEQYISSLGNGYIMNFLAGGALKRGFAVISNKRVYFRGSCFSGQGKSLVKTDEERTVDIKDVTGSGFIYRRYVGALIGLFTALAVLLAGIAGSLYGVGYEWNEISFNQSEAKERQEKIQELNQEANEIKKSNTDIETRIADIEEKMKANQEAMEELEKMPEELGDFEMPEESGDFEIPQEICDLFFSKSSRIGFLEISKDFDRECYDIYLNSELARLMDRLYQDVQAASNNSDNPLPEGIYRIMQSTYCKKPNFSGELTGYYVDNMLDNVYVTYFSSSLDSKYTLFSSKECPCPPDVIGFALDLYDWCDRNQTDPVAILENGAVDIDINYDYSLEELANATRWDDILDEALKIRLSEYVKAEDDAYLASYKSFLEKVSPELLDEKYAEYVTYRDLIYQYVKYHRDEFKEKLDYYLAQERAKEIKEEREEERNQLKRENNALEGELKELRNQLSQEGDVLEKELNDKLSDYERRYKENMNKASSSFALATVAAAIGGLLITFFISCLLVFLDYLKKRKTMFQIQYAGGFIAFDVSYYAKAEIEDFQKQLRRTKDYAEEVKTTAKDTAAPTTDRTETPQTTQNSTPDELRKYADLLKDGLISQEDYDAMKKKLLGL